MEGFCFICNKSSSTISYPYDKSSTKQTQELIKKFFKLLKRYIFDGGRKETTAEGIIGGGSGIMKGFSLVENIASGKTESEVPGTELIIGACEGCEEFMKSFCDLYNDLKTIELLLNWRLWKFSDMAKAAAEEKAGSPINKRHVNAAELRMEGLLEFKTELAKKCTEKLSRSFPRISIPRSTLDKPNDLQVQTSSVLSNKKRRHSELHGDLPDEPLSLQQPSTSAVKREKLIPVMIIDVDEQNDQSSNSNYGNDNDDDGWTESEAETEADDEIETKVDLQSISIMPETEEKTIEDLKDSSSSGTTAKAEQNRRRSLRTVHQCHLCQRTFSTAKRLESHKEERKCSELLDSDPEDDNSVSTAAAADAEDKKAIREEAVDSLEGAASPEINGDGGEDVFVDVDFEPQKIIDKKVEEIQPNPKEDCFRKPIKQKQFKCPKCSKIFHHKGNFTQHLKGHNNKKKTNNAKDKNTTMTTSSTSTSSRSGNKAAFLQRFQCPDCKKLFTFVRDILLHRIDSKKDHSDPNSTDKLTLKIVSFPEKVKASSKKEITEIAKIEVPCKALQCPVESCFVCYFSQEDLEIHSKLHGTFHCQFCSQSFSYAPDLLHHELLKHSSKNTKSSSKAEVVFKRFRKQECPRCDFKFETKPSFTKHFLVKHLSLPLPPDDGMSLKCDICTVKFKQKRQFKEHYKSHHDLNLVKDKDLNLLKRCSVGECPAYFVSRTQLFVHLKYQHNNDLYEEQLNKLLKETSDIKCKDCGKEFNNNRVQLRKHRLKHHVDKSTTVKCGSCPHIFETQEDLDWHVQLKHCDKMKKWEGEFKCQKCENSKVFSTYHALRRHMKWHKKWELPKPPPKAPMTYVCEQCGDVFKAKAGLKMHLVHHTSPETWKFHCEICPDKKRFPVKGALTTHMRTHMGEERFEFVCQVCGVKYAHRHNLRIHVNSKHGDVMQDLPTKKSGNFKKRKGVKK